MAVVALPSEAQAGPYVDTTVVPYGAVDCAAPISRTINVPESFIIDDLDFELVAEHSYRTDTNLTIISPNNTSAALLTGTFTTNWVNYVVRFDDEAPVIVDTGAHGVDQVITGPIVSVQSEGDPLSVFDGENAQGDWTITVCDVFLTEDDGSLNRIELFFTPAPPDLQVSKTAAVYDPDSIGLYAIPGNDVIYTFSVTNSGVGFADSDSIELIDALPNEVEFYNGDIDGDGPETDPISFADSGSGLSFTYATDVAFSTGATRPADFNACSTIAPDSTYRSDITYVCLNPKGPFISGSPDPSISLKFRVRLK